MGFEARPGMPRCEGCALAIEGPFFTSQEATAVNAEVERQLSGDSLRSPDDPTPARIMQCAAAMGAGACGHLRPAQNWVLKTNKRGIDRIRPDETGDYL